MAITNENQIIDRPAIRPLHGNHNSGPAHHGGSFPQHGGGSPGQRDIGGGPSQLPFQLLSPFRYGNQQTYYPYPPSYPYPNSDQNQYQYPVYPLYNPPY